MKRIGALLLGFFGGLFLYRWLLNQAEARYNAHLSTLREVRDLVDDNLWLSQAVRSFSVSNTSCTVTVSGYWEDRGDSGILYRVSVELPDERASPYEGTTVDLLKPDSTLAGTMILETDSPNSLMGRCILSDRRALLCFGKGIVNHEVVNLTEDAA